MENPWFSVKTPAEVLKHVEYVGKRLGRGCYRLELEGLVDSSIRVDAARLGRVMKTQILSKMGPPLSLARVTAEHLWQFGNPATAQRPSNCAFWA